MKEEIIKAYKAAGLSEDRLKKEKEYMVKLSDYIGKMVNQVKNENQMQKITRYHHMIEKYYR